MRNLTGTHRINYFGTPSFWVCDDTEENKTILTLNNIVFSSHTFMAANGETVSRLEWND